MPLYTAPVGARVTVFHGGPVAAHTGVTTESAAVITVTIPGGTIGPNGHVIFGYLADKTGTAGTVTFRMKLNAGTPFRENLNAAGVLTMAQQGFFFNNNSQSAQITSRVTTVTSVGWATETAGTTSTSTHDTSTDKNVTVTIQNASAADSVTIQRWFMQIVHGA